MFNEGSPPPGSLPICLGSMWKPSGMTRATFWHVCGSFWGVCCAVTAPAAGNRFRGEVSTYGYASWTRWLDLVSGWIRSVTGVSRKPSQTEEIVDFCRFLMRQTVTKTTSGPEIDGGDEKLALYDRKNARTIIVCGGADDFSEKLGRFVLGKTHKMLYLEQIS